MAKIKFALYLNFLLGLLILTTITSSAVASPGVVKWSRVNIPTEGNPGNWMLADGSDVQHLTTAIDGALYCYANPSGTSYTLFKSVDGGYSWSHIGRVTDTIVNIATAPDDADVIYYATSANIYKSTDAGNSFTPLSPNPGGAGSNNIEITSIDVAPLGSNNIVAVGTRDTNNSEYGGVYTLDESELLPPWVDTNIGSYDVYSIACSPEFAAAYQLVAVVTDENKTWVKNSYDVNGAWTTGVELKKDDSSSFTITAASDICFPSHFDLEHELFIGVVANVGDVYRVTATEAYDLGVDKDIISLDLAGDIQLLAGVNGAAEVWRSPDAGINWTRSTKEPTGEGKTYVLMAADFADSGKAYAATSGDDSAFSFTADGGIIWNQLSLIDTKISASGIVDLVLSPDYSHDNTLFMLTFGSEHSLWRSLSGGARWERVYSSTVANADIIDRVELSAQYGNDSRVIFIAGTSNSKPTIWKSTDNGQSFIRRFARDPTTGTSFPIKTWAVVNDNTLFVGSYGGSNGLVYRTTNSGSSYSTGAIAGSQSLYSIALSPNYEQDETILVGNRDGWVYWSNDNGISFEPLPPDASSSPLTGKVTVAFAPQFSSNNTVYAASDTPDKGIYRFIIGTSAKWESIDSTLPEDSIIAQLMVSADGVLYATNFQPVDAVKKQGGMERCLNPTYSLTPTFETVTRGLDDGVKLTGLWLCGNQLWSIDAANNRLMTYTDSLTVPVTLTSPPNQAPGIGTTNVSLDWEALSGATEYKWQLDYDTDFSSVPNDFEGDTRASSIRLPIQLELATTYYWRVRVTEPVLSPWSARRSFTTSLGSYVIAPKLLSPEAGASGAGLKPVFQWSAIAGAESYDLLVSTDVSFTNPVIIKIGAYALLGTAWQCDINLNYDTTYYWKVRAISPTTHSTWSAASAFTTKSSPASEPLPSYSTAPALKLNTPGAGARGESVKPIFQWSAIAGANSYELLVSTDVSFVNPIIVKIGTYALPTTAWQCDVNLDYDTTYYWKVRAAGSNTYSDWSAVSAFVTESPPAGSSSPPAESLSPPAESPSPPAESSPPPSQPTTPDWVKWLVCLGGALLLTMVAMLITMVILTVRLRGL